MSAEIINLRTKLAERDPPLKCMGVGRSWSNHRVVAFMFDRAPTDDELRQLHDAMRRAATMTGTGDGNG